MGKTIYSEHMNLKDNHNNYSLIIASGNLGKVKEFNNLLAELPLNIFPPPNEFEVEETGKSFMENAHLKALECSQLTNQWALADDSGLSVDALNGAPGIHSARYASTDQERINKLLKELNNSENRRATFTAAICLASPEQVLLQVEAKCEGFITYSPRGEEGFGYDPIFEVKGIGLTFAEMTKDQKKIYGHRGKAFELLLPEFKNLLGLN